MRNASDKFNTSITPMLTVRNGAAAIEFYKKAFGAVELARAADPTGSIIIAEMAIGDAKFFVSDESPELGNFSPQRCEGTTVRLELSVADPDAVAARAVTLGAKIIFPIADQDYGYRQGRIEDPFGHQWVIGRPLK